MNRAVTIMATIAALVSVSDCTASDGVERISLDAVVKTTSA